MQYIIGYFNEKIKKIIGIFKKKAKSKGKVGSIETLKWISEGEDTDNYEST